MNPLVFDHNLLSLNDAYEKRLPGPPLAVPPASRTFSVRADTEANMPILVSV